MNEYQKLKQNTTNCSFISLAYVMLFIRKVRNNCKKSKQRLRILKQWVSTQQTYCKILQISVNYAVKPLKTKYSTIIRPNQVQIVFTNFQQMWDLSQQMINIIKPILLQMNPNKILLGRYLIKLIDKYQIYSKYFSHTSDSTYLLENLSVKNPTVCSQLQQTIQSEMKKCDLDKKVMYLKDCVQAPFYRIFKYVILLKQYQRKTPKTHPDTQYLTQSLNKFHELNMKHNNQVKKLQEQLIATKLIHLIQQYKNQNTKNKLFNSNINPKQANFITHQDIETIHFNGKIYIYTNFLIITSFKKTNQPHLSFSEPSERLDRIIFYDSFSYAAVQKNLKYFKNILIFVGQKACLHLLMRDELQSFQLYKSLNKLLRSARIKMEEERSLPKSQKINLQYFRPQFRFQVIGTQIINITSIREDTLYIVRVMVPYYYEQQVVSHLNAIQMKRILSLRQVNKEQICKQNFNHDRQREQMGIDRPNYISINQHLQLSLKDIEQINKNLAKYNPKSYIFKNKQQEKIITEKNVLHKTRIFQQQKFYIEQLLNSIFRDESIMKNPIWLLQKLKINDPLWNYITYRNQVTMISPEKYLQFGFHHCETCQSLIDVKHLKQYEKIRKKYVLKSLADLNGRQQNYKCFNYFNCMRLKLLAMNTLQFQTLQQILFYNQMQEGRLDYCFLQNKSEHLQKQKQKIMLVKIYLATVDAKYIRVEVLQNSKVSQIIDEIGSIFDIWMPFDYELVAMVNGQNRVLNRDGLMAELVEKLDIQYFTMNKNQFLKNKNNSSSLKPPLMSQIRNIGHQLFSTSKTQNRIVFKKIVFMHKAIEVKAIDRNRKRKKLLIDQYFYEIKCGNVKMIDEDFIEYAALFYCWQEFNSHKIMNQGNIHLKILEKFIPEEKMHFFSHYQDIQIKITKKCQNLKQLIRKMKNQKLVNTYLSKLITQKALRNTHFYTYYIQADCVTFPSNYCNQNLTGKVCEIGINFKQLLISEKQTSVNPLIRISVRDFEFFTSMFSIFIETRSMQLRFDSKSAYNFGKLVHKYKQINQRFPQHIAGR